MRDSRGGITKYKTCFLFVFLYFSECGKHLCMDHIDKAVILYFTTSLLVHTRIVRIILQFWDVPDLFPTNTYSAYKNCLNNSGILSVPARQGLRRLTRPTLHFTDVSHSEFHAQTGITQTNLPNKIFFLLIRLHDKATFF